jgi:GMP synthase-like glutamine amidotransferase
VTPGGRWAVVQHAEDEGPGLLADLLAAAGAAVADVRLHRGDELPPLHDVDAVVAMGGPMGVHDDDAHPWLGPERHWLAEAVTAGLPVLGVCLGAQQLAAALGAEVRPGGAPELGTGEVGLTDAGRGDPVLGPEGERLVVVQWHDDTFELPAGAVHLARSDRCALQAFRTGPAAYGLQFHIEVDRTLLERWRPTAPPGFDVGEAERRAVEAVGRRVLGRFVATAVATIGRRPAVPVPD